MLIIVDSFVKCFYIFTIMMAMTFLNYAPSCLTIVVLVAKFSTLCLFEKPRVEFFAFSAWFMHCEQGEKFWHEKACCIHLEGVHTIWDAFWEVGIFPLVTGLSGVDTGLTGVEGSQNGHRSNRCGVPVWTVWAVMLYVVCILSWGVCMCSGGACMCAGGVILWFAFLLPMVSNPFYVHLRSR